MPGRVYYWIGWQPDVTRENEAWVFRWWSWRERAWEWRWFRKAVLRFGYQCMRVERPSNWMELQRSQATDIKKSTSP